MNSKVIKNAICAIEYEWQNLSSELSDISENFHFISVKLTALKMKIHNLREMLNEQTESDKKTKLLYKKLTTSLEKIETTMNFKLTIKENLNHGHIKNILAKVKSVEPEIAVLREYIKQN